MKTRRGYTLVEVMIVVLMLSILFAIAAPSIALARSRSRSKSCLSNLRAIQGAKEMWAIENRKDSLAVPVWTDLVGTTKYLRRQPACPSNGTYRIRRVRSTARCSIGGWSGDPSSHTLP